MTSKLQKLTHDLRGTIKVLKSILLQLQREMDNEPLDKARYAKYINTSLQLVDAQEEHCERIRCMEGSDDNGFKKIKLEELISETVAEFEQLFDQHGITTKIVKNSDYIDSVIIGSMYDLKSAFRNLITNSIEAVEKCDKKEIVIQIESNITNDFIRLLFIDSGVGFNRTTVGIIFNDDRLVFSSKKTAGHGLGLLSIKDAIALHKGATIRAENRSDQQGAKVIIKLPCEKKPFMSKKVI